MNTSKLLAGVAAIALLAGVGAASAQQGGQQERPGTQAPSAQPDQKSGQDTSPAAKHEGSTPSPRAQGGNERPQNGARQTQTTPSGEKPGANATQDSEKKSQQGARENNQRQGQTQDMKKDAQNGQAQTDTKKSGADTAAKTELNSEQRTKISQTVKTQNVKRVTNVNFNISVGTVVPRNYSFYPVPAPVVAVVPAYRGYLYLVVGDQMLIIHPRTHEIVAVIAV